MSDLQKAVTAILAGAPQKIVVSAPRLKNAEVARVTFVPQGGGKWQAQRLRGNKAFHETLPEANLAETLCTLLQAEFTQLTATGATRQHSLRITAKGKVLQTSKAIQAASEPVRAQHNRQKNYLLPEGADIPPLYDMGVFTSEGKVAAPMQGKYRQINRFVQLVDDAVREDPNQKLRIIDFGCGKSYLTFVLYHYFTNIKKQDVEMTGLDLKEDVVANCNAAAQKYGYTGLHFEVGDIAGYNERRPVDMVVTLHACDTATDFALAAAARWGAKYIFSVPCCQHEAAAQVQTEELAILTRYGIVKERTAALMTDALRANLLVACGYKTQLVEFVDFEHTPKNILIRAVKTGMPAAQKQRALGEVRQLCGAFHLQPTLLKLLEKDNLI